MIITNVESLGTSTSSAAAAAATSTATTTKPNTVKVEANLQSAVISIDLVSPAKRSTDHSIINIISSPPPSLNSSATSRKSDSDLETVGVLSEADPLDHPPSSTSSASPPPTTSKMNKVHVIEDFSDSSSSSSSDGVEFVCESLEPVATLPSISTTKESMRPKYMKLKNSPNTTRSNSPKLIQTKVGAAGPKKRNDFDRSKDSTTKSTLLPAAAVEPKESEVVDVNEIMKSLIELEGKSTTCF